MSHRTVALLVVCVVATAACYASTRPWVVLAAFAVAAPAAGAFCWSLGRDSRPPSSRH